LFYRRSYVRHTLSCTKSANKYSRVWDTATGQCLRTLVHEDNAPVTTVRFSPNGKFILAHTLDSCIRLWDYVSGSCKKTYQGHVNKKFSMGGAFGVRGKEGFIVSGSEDGDIVFWDVTTKEIVQRASGHDGVVSWVDTHPTNRSMVSGGLDGTVRIWVDISEEEDGLNGVNDLHLNDRNGDAYMDDVLPEVKVEPGIETENDILEENGVNGGGRFDELLADGLASERMDED
jgi:COMPASS component SWD3